MKKSKAGQELYSLAEALTGTAFTLIFAVALFALLFTGVSTFGHYEQKTHEEPIVYEEYHRGMASDTPVQFYAVSAEAALYTKANRTSDYYAYITMEDEKGNQVVTMMQKSSSATTLYDDTLAALKLDAGSFVDEINGKAGTLYYGVISDNSLDQQTVLIDSMLFQNMDEIARQQVREKAQIEELQTLELYTGNVPQSTTVVDETEFVWDGGSWFLLGAAVLLALYIVMWIIRKAGKNAAEQRMAEMTHQAKLHLQEIEQRKVAEAASKFRGPKIVVDIAAVGLFKNRTDIEVVEVLPGVGIHANEFQGCTNLRQISLPNGLMGIGSYAFQDCKSLKDITLPNSNMLIGSNAFSGCTALEHIKIGWMTCFIYENAFEGCEKLIVEAPYGTFPISEFRELLKETAKTVSPEKSPSDNYVVAWTKEMERQVDIRHKAAEKTVQKVEEPKPSPAPAPVDADAWRAEVHRQAEQRAQEDKQRKAAEKTTQDDTQTPPDHSEWAAWAKDKSNHEKLQELCGVKLVHTETQGMLHEFTAYSYTLGPKGWDDIKRIMVTIAASDQKAGAEATLESGSMGSETATETIELSAENKASEMDIKLEENSWMRLTMGAGSKNLSWIFRLRIYNQTGNAVLQILFAPEDTGEVTLYLCGVLAATFGITGKAPSGDVEQGINALIEYIDGRSEHTERTDSAQSADGEQKENTPEGLAVLRSLPAAWVVLGTGLRKQWPAIDIQGFFHVFTDEGAATAFAQPNGFAVEKMTGTALCDHLKEWQRYGITHIRLHQGNETREFLEKKLGFGNNFNSDLQEAMIRYLQTKALNIDGVAETAKIFWMLLCKMIPERLFLVPFCFEGEDINVPVEDNTLRLFPSAAKLIIKQRTEGKILLFDGYPFADKADGRPMHFRTLRNKATGKEVLSVYTDFNEMLPIWKGRAHFALATFDDFKDNYQPTSGVMINPISQALLLEPKDIEEIGKTQASSAEGKTAQKVEETKPTPTAKETAQKEPVQPAPTASPASASNQTPTSADEPEPEAVRILRDKICRKLRDDSYLFDAKGSYLLELLEGEKQRYFKDCPGFGYWPGASFELNLKTGKLWVDLFTYPEPLHGIDAREIYCPISAERFHEIAVECGMSPELQWFRTEEDWARLFDNRLQSVIDKALHRSEKRKAKEKEERRQRNGVELSSECWTQTPGMWIESVRIWFNRVSGSSNDISLTKENGTYYLEGQALSSAEAVWVERQVEAALESHDNSTWSSGDRISVTIRTSRWANVEIKREAVLTKYYELLSQLQRLQNYGSKDMRN